MTILNVLATSVIGATVSLSGAPADEAYIEILDEYQTQDIPALMTVQDVYAHYLMEIDYAEDTDKLEEQDEKEPEDDEDKDKDNDGEESGKDNDEEGESVDETKAPKEADTDEDFSDIRGDVSEESNDDGRNEGRSGNDEGEEESEEATEQESDDETEEADEEVSEGETMTMEATYYTALCDTGCTGTTATGVDVSSSNMHEGKRVIAVDPDVIPLNSTVEVTSGGETFTAIAADTGGDVNGNRIDILVGSVDEANEKGRHSVKVEIVD